MTIVKLIHSLFPPLTGTAAQVADYAEYRARELTMAEIKEVIASKRARHESAAAWEAKLRDAKHHELANEISRRRNAA